MDEIIVYLGTLTAIVIGGLAVIVILMNRGSGSKQQAQPMRAPAEGRGGTPLVQVALMDDGGLAWVVGGRATRDPSTLEPGDLHALETLVARVRAADLSTPPVAPAIAPTPTAPPATSPAPLPTDAPVAAESPVGMPPAVEQPEDEFARPFLGRLRDSIFGVDYETKPDRRVAPRPAAPLKAGKAPESLLDEQGIGIPRFDELNSLVQLKLSELADAPPTTIRTGRDGLLEIVVQGQVYTHIDDVPQEDVRRAMQDAVAIWNNR